MESASQVVLEMIFEHDGQTTDNAIRTTRRHWWLYVLPVSLLYHDIADVEVSHFSVYLYFFHLSLPVYSGSLKRIAYPKQICLDYTLSFECFHCS